MRRKPPAADPEADAAKIAGFLLPFGEQMLREHGELHPSAATVDGEGAVAAVGAAVDGSAAEVVELLRAGLTADAAEGRIRACGVMAMVRIADPEDGRPTDALCVQVDARGGDPLELLVPYDGAGAELVLRPVVARPGGVRIFR